MDMDDDISSNYSEPVFTNRRVPSAFQRRFQTRTSSNMTLDRIGTINSRVSTLSNRHSQSIADFRSNSFSTYKRMPLSPPQQMPRTLSSSQNLPSTAIDPELKDAQKEGNKYHITMNLNAALLGINPPTGAPTGNRYRRVREKSTLLRESQSSVHNIPNQRSRPMSYPQAGNRSVINVTSDGEDIGELMRPPSSLSISASRPVPTRLTTTLQPPTPTLVTAIDGYAIKSVTSSGSQSIPTLNGRIPDVGFNLELKRENRAPPQNSSILIRDSVSRVEPKFIMNVHDTMKVDYQPTRDRKDGHDAPSRLRRTRRGLDDDPVEPRMKEEKRRPEKKTRRSHEKKHHPRSAPQGPTQKRRTNPNFDDIDAAFDNVDPNQNKRSDEIPTAKTRSSGGRLLEIEENVVDGKIGELPISNNSTEFDLISQEIQNAGKLEETSPQGKPVNELVLPRSPSNVAIEKLSQHNEADIDYSHEDGFDIEINVTMDKPSQKKEPTSMFVHRLLKDAPKGSVQQRMNVEREEEEVRGPVPSKDAETFNSTVNVDAVSEKVDLTLADGIAELIITVRNERLVPIRGTEDMFKKSSVVVTRVIDVDLTVTEERRAIYEQVLENQKSSGRLSNKDTFELYKAFVALVEADGTGLNQDQIWIDKNVDEERIWNLRRQANAGDASGRGFEMLDDRWSELDSAARSEWTTIGRKSPGRTYL